MSGKKRIASGDDLSDSEGEIGLNGQVTPPEALMSRKKRKASTSKPLSYSAPSPKIFWSKDDEIVILKGIVDFRKEKGIEFSADSTAFVKYIKDDIEIKFSKDQVMRKIRKLKAKFQDNLVKQPSFTVAHDSKMFDLSLAIWGKDNGNVDQAIVNTPMGKSKVGASVEPEGVITIDLNDDGSAEGESDDELPAEDVDKNEEDETGGKNSGEDEPKKDDGSAKDYSSWDGEAPSDCVDKHVENETGGMENEGVNAENELCNLQDALEETMLHGLSKSAQKLMIQKLRSIRAKERKELSDEWKALLVEEIQLKIKKQHFMAKLTEAVLED